MTQDIKAQEALEEFQQARGKTEALVAPSTALPARRSEEKPVKKNLISSSSVP